MRAGLGELDGADGAEVPLMIIRGEHGQAAGGGGFAVEVEGDGVGLEAIEALDAISAGAGDVDGVVDPFAIFGPADIELVDVRADEVGVLPAGSSIL